MKFQLPALVMPKLPPMKLPPRSDGLAADKANNTNKTNAAVSPSRAAVSGSGASFPSAAPLPFQTRRPPGLIRSKKKRFG
jgi:hypothetical protein